MDTVVISLWNIQVGVNATPRRTDISNDLREATVAAQFEIIRSPSFCIERDYSQNIQDKYQSSLRWTLQQAPPKPKSYISDSTGLSSPVKW